MINMKENRFYQNREKIRILSKTMNLDVSSASRALAHQEGWIDYTKELQAWDALCITYQKAKNSDKKLDHNQDGLVNLADLFDL